MKPIKMNPEKTVENILQQDPQSILGFLQKKVYELKNLNQRWRAEVPSPLSAYSRVANFRDQCLIIEIDSAAWATRLRYLLPDISKKLKHYPELHTLKHIEWYIQPPSHTSIAKEKPSLSLTASNARLLYVTAKHTTIKALQEALLRVAQHSTVNRERDDLQSNVHKEPNG